MGSKEVFDATTIWLSDNHEAFTKEVEKLNDDLAKNYFTVGQEYLQFLNGDEISTEINLR